MATLPRTLWLHGAYQLKSRGNFKIEDCCPRMHVELSLLIVLAYRALGKRNCNSMYFLIVTSIVSINVFCTRYSSAKREVFLLGVGMIPLARPGSKPL